MATLAQPAPAAQSPVSDPEQYTPAEQALLDVFDDIIDDSTPEQRQSFFAELRANAERHGE